MRQSDSNSAVRPEFTIVDMRSGRDLGGHCFDYLMALQAAFEDRHVTIVAPFVQPDPPANTRLNVYVRGFGTYRRAIADHGVGIVHNSSMNDYLCLAVAALTIRSSRRGFCMMMLYREPSVDTFGAGGAWVNRVMIWLISRLIRAGVLRPASDSPTVLARWLELTGTKAGAVVPTPPLPTDADGEQSGALELPTSADPLVVIPGRMRSEKGAANYPVVARAVLERFPRGAIVIQTSETDDASADALATLRSEFARESRVVMLDRHLSGGDYGRLLGAADIAVLPYDTVAYGAGSSGVVGDALSSGAVVVSSAISWVESEYGDDPRVVITSDPASVEAVGDALARARAIDAAAAAGDDGAVGFAASWNAAIDAAIAGRDRA